MRWFATACAGGCKEAVRVHAAGDMTAGNDYVIVGRGEILTVPFDRLAAELSRRVLARR